MVAAALGLLVAGAGAGTAAYFVAGDKDSSQTGDRDPGVATDGAPRFASTSFGNGLSFRGDPGTSWTWSVDHVFPGGMITSNTSGEGAQEGESLILPVAVVVGVAAGYPDERTAVVALDPATGRELWRDEGLSSHCYVAGDDAVACHSDEGLTLVDARTGEHLGTADVDVSAAAPDGEALFVLGYAGGPGDDHSMQLTRLSLDGFEQDWSVRLQDELKRPDEGNEFDGGAWVTVLGDRVQSHFGYLTWQSDPSSGDLIVFDDGGAGGPGEHWTQRFGGYSIGHRDGGATIYDDQGNTLLRAPGSTWGGAWERGPVRDGRVGIGHVLYDLSTGRSVWERPDLDVPDEYGGNAVWWSWVPDSPLVVAHADEIGGSQVLDANTGRTLATLDDSVWNSVYADRTLAVLADGEVVVAAVDGSDRVWRHSLPSVGDDPWITFGSSGTALVASAADTVAGFSDFDGAGSAGAVETGDETDYTTDCGSEPVFTPVEAYDGNGGLTVTVEIHAECPGGQWLLSSGTHVRVTGTDGVVLATGVFDFSRRPQWAPGSDSGFTGGSGSEGRPVVPLVFDYASTWATAREVLEAIRRNVVRVPCETDDAAPAGAAPSHPSYGSEEGAPALSRPEGDDDPGESALEALRRIAAEDETHVDAELDGWWLPQLSSKVEGTTDDGIVYRYEDILAEHLRLRARYDDVRLVFSTDWGSFRREGYWVTVVGRRSDSWEAPARWCRDQGWDRDHCFAKQLNRGGSWEGTLKYFDDLP